MTPEHWKQIQENLDRAIALAPQERESFLDQLGSTDLELKEEVQSLLSYESSDPQFLRTAAMQSLASFERPEPNRTPRLDRMIGPYRVTELLGAGGMGDVYRAVRADGQYDQKVALKIVRSDFGGELTQRFRNERQILASLNHPNIARILDGSTTEDGIPYLVMELIDGLPITDYCDQHNLSIDERLKLFRTVCAAVHHAHQHLVVHRDIKPSNILVTADGTAKLLDFGIAKILGPNPAAQNATRTGLLMMTPEYASPEQLRGEPITTASDVYSLGLVLYELLTGCHPFRARGNMPHEIARGVLEMDPERPSGALRRKSTEKQPSATASGLGHTSDSPDKLSRLLSGDLDSIVLKALRKEPRDRYSSVDQLSEDIRRHLEGLPVSAREGTLAYRVSKYVLRHKVGVASVALVFLMLVTGIAVTFREARIAKRNELRAERRFNDVRKLANSLLFDIHDSVRDLPGSTPARKLIVENALQYLDSLSSEAAGDPSLQRELATAYERVGEVQGHYLLNNLGETENALRSYQKALRLRQDLSSLGSSWQDKLALARCYRLVSVQMQAMGNVRNAAEGIQSAISLAESIRKDHPQEISILDELSSDYLLNGQIHQGGNLPSLVDFQSRSESYRKAIAVDADWVKLAPSSEEAQHALAVDQMFYADTLSPDRRDEALRLFQHSLKISKQISAQTTSIQRARDVATVYSRLGNFYDSFGDHTDSLNSFQSGLQIYRDLVVKDPQNKLLSQGLAIAHANVAAQLGKMGRMGRARGSKAEIASAIDLMENLVRGNPNNASQQGLLAEMHKIRAQILRLHEPAASVADYKLALVAWRNLLEKDSNNMSAQLHSATCSLGMAKAELQLHHSQLAAASFGAALDAVKPLLSGENPDKFALYMAAYAYAGLGRLESEQARNVPPSQRKPHLESARNWFHLSLEQLARIQQPFAASDDDVGPVDSAQITKELSRSETALRHIAR